jgi:N-acetylglucosamine kinase-like BadF-type ATPase
MVTNDTHLLAAPMTLYEDMQYTVGIIAGTGAIAVSFKEDEERKGMIKEIGRSGGWGWMLGDEGGGYSVGREALRLVLRKYDGATVSKVNTLNGSKLKEKILERFGISNVMEILRCVYLPDPRQGSGAEKTPDNLVREKRISTLSPLVFEAAFQDGDPLALEVLETCVQGLLEQAEVLLGKATEEYPGLVDPANAVLSFGGSLTGVGQYREMILDAFKRRGYVFKHVTVVEDPAMIGAASLATTYK